MKHSKKKMTGVFYVLVSRGYQELARCGFHFRDYKVHVEFINSSIVCDVNGTYFFLLYKYYKRLKRKIKTPQLAFIKTNQLK